MRGLRDRWRLQLPARSHGLPLLRGPLSLCAACSHPSLMSSPSTGGGWSSSTGDLHPKPENVSPSLLRASHTGDRGNLFRSELVVFGPGT